MKNQLHLVKESIHIGLVDNDGSYINIAWQPDHIIGRIVIGDRQIIMVVLVE